MKMRDHKVFEREDSTNKWCWKIYFKGKIY